ncbi:MAG: DUF2470 domain-containing protein [Actinomycetales bacterium]|nr:DUF2470 domain-containing protein [Actinomycetales bacterium]
MSTEFAPEVVAAVTGHMNGDHPEDNLLIVRAFGAPGAESARMTGLDSGGGVWSWSGSGASGELTVAWPGGRISERPEIRREVVKLYDAACAALGVEPRPHD